MEIDTAEGEKREQGSGCGKRGGLMRRLQQTGDWGQSDERVLQYHHRSSCSCQFWDLTGSSQHTLLFISTSLRTAVNYLQAPVCEKGLLSLRLMLGRRESPSHIHIFPSHCHFNILIPSHRCFCWCSLWLLS